MIPSGGDPNNWLFVVAGGLYAIAILATLWRVVVGPSLADRVVALDLLGFIVVSVLFVYSIVTDQPSLLGVGLVGALVMFLGTAAFAIYLDRRPVK